MAGYLFFPQRIGIEHRVSVTNEVVGYEAERMHFGQPRRGCRSTADDAAWVAIFDAGANSLFNGDTWAFWGNTHNVQLQMNTDNVWTSPAINETLSLVAETVAAAALSLSGCTITRTSGTWEAGALIGMRARFATNGTTAIISDNTTTKLWCQGTDMSGGTGDLQIIKPRAWATLTQASYRWLRVRVPQQVTGDGYYALRCFSLGVRVTLPPLFRGLPRTLLPVSDAYTRGGSSSRIVNGPMARSWNLAAPAMTKAMWHELTQRLANQGAAPAVYVPDITDAHDVAWVLPSPDISWSPQNMVIPLVEVV